MNKILPCLFLLLLYGCAAASYGAQASIDGYWEGTGGEPGEELKFMITFRTEADGIKGAIDVPDTATSGLPLADISVTGSKVHFVMPAGGGRFPFDGQLSGDTISGTYQFGKQTLPFILKRTLAKPLPYKLEEVSYRSGNLTLAATLLLPNNKGRHPAIVFQNAARQHKRDYWRFYADYFARRGIACLIYDNRGVGASTGDWRASFEDLAADGLAAIHYLQSRKDINRRQVGLLAASQGGWIAPLVASRSRDVAFVMLIAAPSVTTARNIQYESETRLRDAGFSEADISTALAFKKTVMEMINEGLPEEKIEAATAKGRDEKWFSHVGIPEKDHWMRRWFPLVYTYDPAPDWAKVKVPVLNVLGELDKNVRVSENVPIMEQALRRGGNRDFTIKVFPKANHGLLVFSSQGRPQLAPGFLDFMADWLLKRVTVKN